MSWKEGEMPSNYMRPKPQYLRYVHKNTGPYCLTKQDIINSFKKTPYKYKNNFSENLTRKNFECIPGK